MNNLREKLWEYATQSAHSRKIKLTNDLLWVSIPEQTLEHWRNGQHLRTYDISTSERPPSVLQDSLGTPTGWLRITEKIGDRQPTGMVFKGRVPRGYSWPDAPPADQEKALITSRILRLTGCETGWNAGPGRDTWERYIYLHGTNRHHRIGEPQSAGCVLLRDEEMIALFDEVPEGTLVWILDKPTIEQPS